MKDAQDTFVSGGMTRRNFLKTSSGLIAMSVVAMGSLGAPRARAQGWSPQPGKANQRYEGLQKVTGEKIFARDFNARDLHETHGWPKHQWYGMYLRALTTTRQFRDVDLSALPTDARPTKVVRGGDFATGILTPRIVPDRDLIVDAQIEEMLLEARQEAITTGSQLDHPYAVEFDLVVQQGNRPDFLGQAVALLLFDDAKTYRRAKAIMQFRDSEFQVYGPDIGPNPDDPPIFSPQTQYVKQGDFSYYSAKSNSEYQAGIQDATDAIEKELNDNPDWITHRFNSDMRAMDPMFMEPESGLIWYNEDTSKMTVLLGTQSPDGDVSSICSMYGNCGDAKDVKEVELISCYPGGGFGGRDKSPFSLMLALCADFAEGNPVKLEYDRFEQFRVGLKRHACELTGSVTVTPEKELKLVQMNMSFDGGGRKNLSPYVAQLACLCAGGSYRVPMANIYGKATHSENVSGGSQRGFGGPQAFFAIETAIDELCLDNGWDPLRFRLDNAVKENETTVVGGPIKQQLRLKTMLRRAGHHALWRRRRAIQDGYAQRGLMYGTGLAMSLQAYGTSGDGMVAAVTLGQDGTWKVQSDGVDMGNGSATTLGVVIGPILGANATEVDMGGYTLFGQTQLKTNSGIGCWKTDGNDEIIQWSDPHYTKKGVGSSSACLTGLHQVHVVQQCATAVMATTIIPAARQIWGDTSITEDDVTWEDGVLFHDLYDPIPLPQIGEHVHNADNGIPTGALSHAYFQESWVSADYETPIGKRTYALDSLATYPANGDPAEPIWRQNTSAMDCQTGRTSRTVWAPCVNVVGLTVDRTSGQVQVENILSVLNAGRIHVPQLVSGQSQGGVAMAMGWTLHEDMPPGMAGPADGTWNLNRYHVPRYMDVPLGTKYKPGGRAQELVLMAETEADKGQGRGIAEAVMCSIAPAISNALKDATGVRFTSLPITPAKILEGLNQ